MGKSQKWPPPLRCFIPLLLLTPFFFYFRSSTDHLIHSSLRSLLKGKLLTFLLPPLIGFVTSYYIYEKTSAKSAGQPNQAEIWLKHKGYVSDAFHFSMKYDITLFNRWVINVHLHHWLYCFISIFVVNYIEMRTLIGRRVSEDLGDFTMGWLYGMGAGGVSQGLSYEDWTSCIWITSAPPRLLRRGSSLESIISITADPDYGTEEKEKVPDFRSSTKTRSIVLRHETLKWTVAIIALANMGIAIPVVLGLISPTLFMPSLAALFSASPPQVERVISVFFGLALMQIGATRWLWIRNFYGSTYGYRYLAGLSFLLEGANAYVLKREEIVGREEGLGTALTMFAIALSSFLIRPESLASSPASKSH